MQIMFIYVDINDENLAKPFLTMFGLEESTNTVVSFQVNNNYLFINLDNCGNLYKLFLGVPNR
jgi:hypothetical protein